ncbi:hypothetical protein J7M22_08320 [Candidatus Poribacteria bacterium]|nr:hypothetical protein [Candidatus Poribacteria bacterium]
MRCLRPSCLVILILTAFAAWGEVQEPFLELSKGRLLKVVFSPDNSYIAVSTTMGIWLYDPETLQEKDFIEAKGVGRTFDISPDGSLIALAEDGRVRFWDVRQNKELRTLDLGEFSVNAISYSPDGEHIALSNYKDNTVSIWNVKTGEKEIDLPPFLKSVSCVLFSPDGRFLATSGLGDIVRVWNARSGNLVWRFKVEQRVLVGGGISFYFPPISFSPDGKLLAIGDWSGKIILCDLETGRVIHSWKASNGGILLLKFLPDGRSIICSDVTELKIWDLRTYQPVKTIGMDKSGDVSFSPDGRKVAIRKEDVVLIGDARTWEIRGRIEGFITWTSYLAISPDDKILATSRNGGLLWDLGTGRLLRRFGNSWEIYALAFTPDGERLIGAGQGRVRIWDAETMQELLHGDVIHKGHLMSASRIKLSPDGKLLLLINTWSGVIKVLRLGDLEEIGTWDYKTYDAAISPDGRLLAAGMGGVIGEQQTVLIWDIATGKRIARLERGWEVELIKGIEFGSYGRSLASASKMSVVVWDLRSGEIVKILESPVADFIGSSLISYPDGDFLILERYKGDTLRVWKVMEERVIAKLRIGDVRTGVIAFSPDRQLLAVSTPKGTILVWRIPKAWEVDPKGKLITRWGGLKSWLGQNFPNPANPETWIPFSISEDGRVIVEIYDLSGGLVRRLDLGYLRAGAYLTKGKAAYWDGRDERGERVASGVYFYSIRTPSYFDVRKLVIMR